MNTIPPVLLSNVNNRLCRLYNKTGLRAIIEYSYQTYHISSSNTHFLPLADKGIFPLTNNPHDRVYHIKLKSSNFLVISSFVKYSYWQDKITIKQISLLAYDTYIKKSKLITLTFPPLTSSAKDFNIAKFFSFSINMISNSSYLIFVVLFNLVFIISIKEIDNKLVHDIIYKDSGKRCRTFYLGYQLKGFDIIYYLLLYPKKSFISFKCEYGGSSNIIEVSKSENSIEGSPNLKLNRFSRFECKWTIFLGKQSLKNIIVNKDNYEVYQLNNPNNDNNPFLLNDNLYLINSSNNNDNDEVNLLKDEKVKQYVIISQYELVFNHDIKECNVNLIREYSIQSDLNECYYFSIVNHQCFYVNFHSNIMLYFINPVNKIFEYVLNINIGSLFFFAEAFNLDCFQIQDQIHITIETLKEHNIVFFEFDINKQELYSSSKAINIINEDNANEDSKQKEQINKNKDSEGDYALKQINSQSITNKDEKDKNHIEVNKENTMHIIQRKDNFPSPMKHLPVLQNNQNTETKNINIIDTSLFDNLLNTQTECKTVDYCKERKHILNTEPVIDTIVSIFKSQCNELENQTNNFKETYNQNSEDLSAIMKQVLEHNTINKDKNIFKPHKEKLPINKYSATLLIHHCINETIVGSNQFKPSSGFTKQINISSDNMQRNQQNANNIPFNPFSQFKPMQQVNQNSNSIPLIDTINNNVNYLLDNTMISNWQQLLNLINNGLQDSNHLICPNNSNSPNSFIMKNRIKCQKQTSVFIKGKPKQKKTYVQYKAHEFSIFSIVNIWALDPFKQFEYFFNNHYY